MKVAKTVKTQEREKSIWQGKKFEGKEQQKKRFEEEIVDAPFESNINAVVEKHLIKNLHIDVVVNE